MSSIKRQKVELPTGGDYTAITITPAPTMTTSTTTSVSPLETPANTAITITPAPATTASVATSDPSAIVDRTAIDYSYDALKRLKDEKRKEEIEKRIKEIKALGVITETKKNIDAVKKITEILELPSSEIVKMSYQIKATATQLAFIGQNAGVISESEAEALAKFGEDISLLIMAYSNEVKQEGVTGIKSDNYYSLACSTQNVLISGVKGLFSLISYLGPGALGGALGYAGGIGVVVGGVGAAMDATLLTGLSRKVPLFPVVCREYTEFNEGGVKTLPEICGLTLFKDETTKKLLLEFDRMHGAIRLGNSKFNEYLTAGTSIAYDSLDTLNNSLDTLKNTIMRTEVALLALGLTLGWFACSKIRSNYRNASIKAKLEKKARDFETIDPDAVIATEALLKLTDTKPEYAQALNELSRKRSLDRKRTFDKADLGTRRRRISKRVQKEKRVRNPSSARKTCLKKSIRKMKQNQVKLKSSDKNTRRNSCKRRSCKRKSSKMTSNLKRKTSTRKRKTSTRKRKTSTRKRKISNRKRKTHKQTKAKIIHKEKTQKQNTSSKILRPKQKRGLKSKKTLKKSLAF
jgi:hypothetical protein